MSNVARRSLPSFALAAALGAATLVGYFSPTLAHAEDGEQACAKKPGEYKVKRVGDACKSGGRKAVSELMKAAVKAGKKDDDSLKCKTCHSDMKTFALADEAAAVKKLGELVKLVP